MKIMMVITGMQSGGAERVMAILCNELSKRNQINLVVLKSKKSDYVLSEKVNVFAGNIINKNVIKAIEVVKEQIDLIKPDIVLSFMNKSNIITLMAMEKTRHKAPVVVAERANPYNATLPIKIIRKILYHKANGCVFQTKQAQEYYKSILKCNSVVIKNPLNPDFKVKTFEGSREKKIVCVGRLSKEKNQQLLINAFSKICKKYPEYIVEIYGEGPLRNKLQKHIEKLDLSEKVFLKGRKDNIQEYINNAEIFVLPSNSEGMPNALLEAMTLGIACIATDCPIGGPAVIIENEKNGILLPMNDIDKMADTIEKLIINKKLAETLRENAKQIAIDYEATKVCKEWEEYLKECYENYKNN